MTTREQYDTIHKQAKFIICLLVSGLLVTSRLTDLWILDVFAVFIWFFGVNTVGYLLEELHHWKHRHNKL